MNSNTEMFQRVSEFLNAEADLLDHLNYTQWLSLWAESGLYIVPTNPLEEDFKNALNIAYDDAEMRALRVERLEGGESVSTQNAIPTSRQVSAIHILSEEGNRVTVRCSYCLYENKSGDLRPYPGTLEFNLVDTGSSFQIEQKVVRLLRGNEYVATVAYIF